MALWKQLYKANYYYQSLFPKKYWHASYLKKNVFELVFIRIILNRTENESVKV